MTFAVEAEVYDRFVGRYGEALGRKLVAESGLRDGMRALDVGAGTGKLTAVLAEFVGEPNVAAVEPSEPFAAALGSRFPRADVRRAAAENMPFPDESFDVVFAQLVVNFLADPQRGVGEMRRVAKTGGLVAGAVWDYPEGMTLLTAFWEAAEALDPGGLEDRDERRSMRFDEEGELGAFWREMGLDDVSEGELVVSASYGSFEELWEPLTRGVGPAGAHAASLAPAAQEELRARYREQLGSPEGPFELQARAWYAVGKK